MKIQPEMILGAVVVAGIGFAVFKGASNSRPNISTAHNLHLADTSGLSINAPSNAVSAPGNGLIDKFIRLVKNSG